MDVFYTYTYGTAGWLSVQAAALLFAPKVVINMLSTGMREVTDVEIYLSRSTSINLLTLSILMLALTGSIPLTSSIPVSTELQPTAPATSNTQNSPYVYPTLLITTTYHAAQAFYCYMNWQSKGSSGFVLGIMGFGGMAMLGGWTVFFGMDGGRHSNKTGADKRTSGFLFPSKVSAGAQKREWRKGQ